MTGLGYDPMTGSIAFETVTAAPLSSLDLLAIAPFIIAAMVVALVRKLRKNRA